MELADVRPIMTPRAATSPCRCTAGWRGSADTMSSSTPALAMTNCPGLAEGHRLDTRYLERLAELGLTPNDIDYVLCTHLHVDHVGWNTRLENGRWVPTFPNAHYVFSRTEYEAAKKDASNPTSPPFFKPAFEDCNPSRRGGGQGRLVDGVHQLLDCLTLRPAPGHSPGHLRIELRSQGSIGVLPATCCIRRSRFPCGNGAPASAGTGAWRRRHGASCFNFAPPRTPFCCPATFKRPMSGVSSKREERSPSTSGGSFLA